jgi:hypothetical protein
MCVLYKSQIPFILALRSFKHLRLRNRELRTTLSRHHRYFLLHVGKRGIEEGRVDVWKRVLGVLVVVAGSAPRLDLVWTADFIVAAKIDIASI